MSTVNHQAFIIEHPSCALLPDWNRALKNAQIAVGQRVDWQSLLPGQLQRRGESVIVANAVPKPQEALLLFRWLRENPIRVPTLAILPPDDPPLIRIAADAVDDFLLWPVNEEELRQRILRLLGPAVEQATSIHETLIDELALAKVIGNDPAFLRTFSRVTLFGSTEAPVLLTGETGTGKELCARLIHLLSRRRRGPFIPVECGALPEELFENELFGHARGAFTTAHADQKGLVTLANGGTLFLDEVDSLPLVTQGKLLRLIQENTYRPLGSEQFTKADIRILAASNANLKQLVDDKRFRADLYFRLDVLRVHLPPLRERAGDISLLARSFVGEICHNYSVPRKTISPAAIRLLESHNWPGNVRELYNTVQRAVLTTGSAEIVPSAIDLHQEAMPEMPASDDFRSGRQRAIAQFEESYVRRLLEKHNGNITHAACEAGKERRAFGRLAKKYRFGNK